MIELSIERRNHAVWVLKRTLVSQGKHVVDVIVLAGALALAYLLRFDFSIPANEQRTAVIQLPLVVIIQIAALSLAGAYSFIWRYVGLAEVKSFVAAAIFGALPILVLRLYLPPSMHSLRVPLSIIIMDTVLSFGGVMSVRVARRALYEKFEKRRGRAASPGVQKKRALLVGAGRVGMLAARELLANGNVDLDVAGFVDDDPGKRGSVISGVRVLGKIDDLPALAARLDIEQVVISLDKAPRWEFRKILDICGRIPVKVRVLPSICEIAEGKVKASRIRDVQIEDLLGREPVQLDERELRESLCGKVVLVTGAGGSIGSELARQVARYQPRSLLLVERAEFALFEIHRELRGTWPDLVSIPLVADIGDRARMASIFSRYDPQVVLHAAAHKHVPMMETNSTEAIKNNVLATRRLGEVAAEFGAGVFVLISTDKAVRPSSVMGASKRMAELVIQDLNREYETRFLAVRFGNVIGSTGSVIPIFRDQIRKGGPVTVTHPDMVRYFMTIPEAAQLVLQASSIGNGGEIFILDMGEPVRVLDLAREAILSSGLKPFEDIDIVFTGIRPGEKLFEELEMTDEHLSGTKHPKIFVCSIAEYASEKVRLALRRLEYLAERGEEVAIRNYLNEFLPEARLGVTGKPAETVRRMAATAD